MSNSPLYDAALAADRAWQAELVTVYGRRAGDARYTHAGTATPTLARLSVAKVEADKAWREARLRERAAIAKAEAV